MEGSLRASVTEPLREAVPFLLITGVWIVVMLVLYGVFLATKPSGVSYGPFVHASVFVVPLIAFVGQVLAQAVKTGRA